jgi:hypothetical protein
MRLLAAGAQPGGIELVTSSRTGWSAIVGIAAVLGAGMLPGAEAPARQPLPVVLPGVRYFPDLRADLLEPRAGAGLIFTNLLATGGTERPEFSLPDSVARSEVQGTAALGASLPLLHLFSRSDGGVVVVGQAGITARFRIARPSRDDLGQDWFVAIPVEVRRGDWAYRFRISHRSSHLGDEFMEETGAQRLEFGGEAVDTHVARQIGTGHIYLGASWIFRSYTMREPIMRALGRRDRFLIQAGADGAWDPWPESRADLVGGVDVQAAQRTAWRRQATAAAGLRWSSDTHTLQVLARFFDGPSFMGEFFLSPERYVALEVVAEF